LRLLLRLTRIWSAALWLFSDFTFFYELFEISAAFQKLECALLLNGLRLCPFVVAVLAGVLYETRTLYAAGKLTYHREGALGAGLCDFCVDGHVAGV